MQNRFFDDEEVALLLNSAVWRIISSYCPPDVKPVKHEAHQQWLAKSYRSGGFQCIFIVLHGHGHYSHNWNIYPFTPGTVFLFDPYEAPNLECPPWTPNSDQLWLYNYTNYQDMSHYEMRIFSVRNGQYMYPPLVRQRFDRDELGFALQDVIASSKDAVRLPAAARSAVIRSAISTLMSRIVSIGYLEASASYDNQAHQDSIVKAVKDHIESAVSASITLDNLASFSGYSKYYLSRMFKAHTGQSIHQFLDACRIARVSAMLKEGHTNNDIAIALGFGTLSAFLRWHQRWRQHHRMS